MSSRIRYVQAYDKNDRPIFEGVDPSTGAPKPKMIARAYQEFHYYENVVLETGAKETYFLCQKADPGWKRNYQQKYQHISEFNEAEYHALTATFHGPDLAVFNPQETSGENATRADAYNQWLAGASVEVSKNKDIYAEETLEEMLPWMPVMFNGASPHAPALYDFNKSNKQRSATRQGLYFVNPPIRCFERDKLQFRIKHETDVPALLSGCVIRMRMICHEFPNNTNDIQRPTTPAA